MNTSSKLLFRNSEISSTPCSNKKTFNNTDTWDKDYLDTIKNISPDAISTYNKIPKIPPPTNCSYETKKELEDIKIKQGNITMEQQQQINKELTLNYIYYIFQATECEIKELNKLMNNYITPIIFKLKHEFNRVRPYKLDKLIIPTAPEPKHAAYPSGHSTQAYFISALLSQKYPVKKNSNDKMAIRVATNREVAGIHYVSDSKYGKIVAEYLSKNININDFLNC
jgi:hypothetical protein